MVSALLAASLVIAAAPAPFTQVASVEGITEYRLPNGLRVLLVPDSSKPSTTVNLTVFVGSRNENYGEKGMAHLFEHMLFKSTKKFKDVKQILSDLGGEANGTTWFDRTNYFESFPASDANVKLALEVEAERLVNAIVSKDQLATEMTVVRNELEMGENQPSGVLTDRVISAAYTWHNYGDSTIGPRSDIEQVPTERLQAFYKEHYQPDNAMLVVAGRFDEKLVFSTIASTFGAIPKPTRALQSTYTQEPEQDGERSVTVRRVGGTPVLVAGYHVPAGSNAEYAAIDVLDRVLGDAPSGRLYQALVNSKKAAKTSCMNFQLRDPGYFMCVAELREKDAAAPAREGLLSVIEGMAKKPVTDAEVKRAKATLLKQFDLMLNSTDRVGITLSEFAALGDWRLFFIHRDRIRDVTTAQVNDVAKRYFIGSNRTLGEYVPTEAPVRASPPQLADLKPTLDAYKGDEGLSAGETFEATPKNIQARTQTFKLPNGLQVAVLPKKTRGGTVALTLDVRFGTEASLMKQRAAQDLTLRLLSRGTKAHDRQAFRDALDEARATFGVHPLPQGAAVSMEFRKPQLAAALGLLAEAVMTPAFDAKEFESARREVLANAEQQKDDPMAVGMNETQRSLANWPVGHPYAIPTYDQVIAETTALKLDAVKAFHKRFYGGQDALLAVVGDVDAKELEVALTKLFGSWKSNEAYARAPNPFKPLTAANTSKQMNDKAMAFFGAGQRFQLQDTSPDFAAMHMADFMLGGGFLNGRIPQRLREKEGLSYGAGTMLRVDSHDDNALLLGYAIYNPTNVSKVEKGFFEEVERALKDGFTASELELAKQGLMQAREQGRAEDGSLSSALVDHLDDGRTFAWDDELDAKLKALTPADVNAALRKYIDAKRFVVMKVGDFKAPAPAPEKK